MARQVFVVFALFVLATVFAPLCVMARPNQGDLAMALANQDQLRPFASISGSPLDGRFDANNHVIGGTVGVGGPVWRSDNGRHSVGLGATASRGYMAYRGHRARSRPNYGVGASYTFRF